ncbi:T9SS type A sorting domain-containing protein [bacterium]|nr:T9SS type A sorting domain-containing protein [bacterium]
MRERVLSRYTAFLALEPNDTVKVCLDCKDETVLVPPTSVFAREETPADSVLQAYPNPFNAATTLRLRLPANLKSGEVSLRIYNVMGQIVRAYDVTVEAESRLFQFTWEGRNEAGQTLATGTYYAVLQTPAQRYSVKLLMVK